QRRRSVLVSEVMDRVASCRGPEWSSADRDRRCARNSSLARPLRLLPADPHAHRTLGVEPSRMSTAISLPRRGRVAAARTSASEPAWVRAALVGVLALAAALFLWGIARSGYSNTYYAAAVKSASESWKAWFFGSLDPGSFITVDKPPLS